MTELDELVMKDKLLSHFLGEHSKTTLNLVIVKRKLILNIAKTNSRTARTIRKCTCCLLYSLFCFFSVDGIVLVLSVLLN